MSAREELFEALTGGWPLPGEAESVNRLLDAHRAKVLAEAADKVAENLKDTPEYGLYVADFLRRMADETADGAL